MFSLTKWQDVFWSVDIGDIIKQYKVFLLHISQILRRNIDRTQVGRVFYTAVLHLIQKYHIVTYLLTFKIKTKRKNWVKVKNNSFILIAIPERNRPGYVLPLLHLPARLVERLLCHPCPTASFPHVYHQMSEVWHKEQLWIFAFVLHSGRQAMHHWLKIKIQ